MSDARPVIRQRAAHDAPQTGMGVHDVMPVDADDEMALAGSGLHAQDIRSPARSSGRFEAHRCDELGGDSFAHLP